MWGNVEYYLKHRGRLVVPIIEMSAIKVHAYMALGRSKEASLLDFWLQIIFF